jgi:enoyl-CoA hydratase/carnithine racemase
MAEDRMAEHDNDRIYGNTVGGVRTVTFNRPGKKNALTQEMYAGLVEEMMAVAEDPKVRVLVFTGAGDVFTSGNDVGDFLRGSEIEGKVPAFQFIQGLPRFPKPLLAAVNGLAIGIGTTMLLHCDMVLASPEAVFSVPFARLGLCPEAGSSLLLPRLAGMQRASELLMLGEPFDVHLAKELGLVNEIVPADELSTRVAERAAAIAELPPAAVRATKALIRGSVSAGLAETMHREGEVFHELLASPEAAEAASAFLEKRAPDFSRFE